MSKQSIDWAHLPNAKHIDRILVDMAANPDKWGTAIDTARNTARNAVYCDAWDAAHDAARNAARNAARDAAYYAALNAARVVAAFNAAYYAILALIAYDDCAYLLNENQKM